MEGQQTITIGKPDDFSLKCEVTDSDNNTATDIHSIMVGGGLAKAQGTKVYGIHIDAVPEQVELTGNYPNPFNPSTTIRFGLPEDSNVKLTIYSSTGQKVINFINGFFSRGYHELMWDGKNRAGNLVSTGIYIFELKAGNHRIIKKMVFAK
ncbi:T9SS type A sorting domain-containing protein [Calditrichota bacterium LG25]